MANKLLGEQEGSFESTTSAEKNSTGQFYVLQKDGSYVLLVLAQDLNQTDDQILATTGVPHVGDILGGFGGPIVQSIKAKEKGYVRHPTTHVKTSLWEVTIEADSRLEASQIKDDPTDFRPKRRWYTEKSKEVRQTDLTQEAIETFAHEQIVMEDDFVDLVLEVERYENYPTNPATIIAYAGHCNSGTFYGAPIGTVLMDDIQSDEEFLKQDVFIKVRYVLKFRMRRDEDAGAWEANTVRYRFLLQQGYLYLPAVGAVPQTYLDKHGHPMKVNLNTDGTKLPDTSDPIFTGFPLVPYADFSALNLEF